MTELVRRKSVDLLVEQFWRKGYLTLSRKYGTYLPEPTLVGGFEVDVVARQNNKYAIGLTIAEDDLKNQDSLLNKIKYLATRQTRRGNSPVTLFIGVKEENFKFVKFLIEQLQEDLQKNIRLVQIVERPVVVRKRLQEKQHPLFS